MLVKTNKVTERFLFKSNAGFTSLPDNVKEAFFDQLIVKQFKKGQNIFIELLVWYRKEQGNLLSLKH